MGILPKFPGYPYQELLGDGGGSFAPIDYPQDIITCPCCGSEKHINCECNFDPYIINYHDGILLEASSEWRSRRLEELIIRSLADIVLNVVFGIIKIAADVLDNFTDVFNPDGELIVPEITIEHMVTVKYVRTFHWEGKIRVIPEYQHRIVSVEEYLNSFKENRQYGVASMTDRLFDLNNNKIICKFWAYAYGFPGSLLDLRCGKPYTGQELFFTCDPN